MILLAFALTIAAVDFTAYPGDEPLAAPAAKPVITGPAAKFAARIREAAKEPADFNGHYKVARWGCGSNCLQWAVIDLRTGRVQLSPRMLASCAPGEAAEAAQFPDWLDYRADSRLLVAYECEDPKNGLLFDTRRFYALQKGALVSLRTERLKGELGSRVVTREDRKYVLGFGAACGVFGIACGIVVAIVAHPNTGYRFFFVPSGLGAFLTGALNWWLLIGWKSKLSVRRGILAGALAGIGAHYVCWILVMWGLWAAWKLGLYAANDVGDPVNALWGAAAFTAISLLFMGWITVPGGAWLGGSFAALQKRLEARRLAPG